MFALHHTLCWRQWTTFTSFCVKCYLMADFPETFCALFFFCCRFSWLRASVGPDRCALVAHEIKLGWDLVQNRKATHTWFQWLQEWLHCWHDAFDVSTGPPRSKPVKTFKSVLLHTDTHETLAPSILQDVFNFIGTNNPWMTWLRTFEKYFTGSESMT